MEIIPAIDLINGECVRLYQGNYGKKTVYSPDPASVALRWQSEGASRLHIVDLDGAAEGKLCNLSAIKEITESVNIPVQVGGGIRHMETIEQLVRLGIERAILGTAAVENPGFVREACSKYGEHIIIGIDARDGLVATRGWLKKSSVMASELAIAMVGLGAVRFIYTDISRDGTLTSPNFEAIAGLVSQLNVPVIAAGGISSVHDLVRLAGSGVEAAIVGQAIYTGDVILEQAIKALSGESGLND